MIKLFLTAFASVAAIVAPISAEAANRQSFSEAAFMAAKKAGKPILVEVAAPWCPTCQAQKPVLARLTSDPKHAALMVFEIDFDSQKRALRLVNAQKQSTLIVYDSGREVGRLVGETDADRIGALLDKAG